MIKYGQDRHLIETSSVNRGHLEDILDISWSNDGAVLVSGSVDNSVIVWNVATGMLDFHIDFLLSTWSSDFSTWSLHLIGDKIAILKEPKGFVQGIVYDPLNSIFAVLSTDR